MALTIMCGVCHQKGLLYSLQRTEPYRVSVLLARIFKNYEYKRCKFAFTTV